MQILSTALTNIDLLGAFKTAFYVVFFGLITPYSPLVMLGSTPLNFIFLSIPTLLALMIILTWLIFLVIQKGQLSLFPWSEAILGPHIAYNPIFLSFAISRCLSNAPSLAEIVSTDDLNIASQLSARLIAIFICWWFWRHLLSFDCDSLFSYLEQRYMRSRPLSFCFFGCLLLTNLHLLINMIPAWLASVGPLYKRHFVAVPVTYILLLSSALTGLYGLIVISIFTGLLNLVFLAHLPTTLPDASVLEANGLTEQLNVQLNISSRFTFPFLGLNVTGSFSENADRAPCFAYFPLTHLPEYLIQYLLADPIYYILLHALQSAQTSFDGRQFSVKQTRQPATPSHITETEAMADRGANLSVWRPASVLSLAILIHLIEWILAWVAGIKIRSLLAATQVPVPYWLSATTLVRRSLSPVGTSSSDHRNQLSEAPSDDWVSTDLDFMAWLQAQICLMQPLLLLISLRIHLLSRHLVNELLPSWFLLGLIDSTPIEPLNPGLQKASFTFTGSNATNGGLHTVAEPTSHPARISFLQILVSIGLLIPVHLLLLILLPPWLIDSWMTPHYSFSAASLFNNSTINNSCIDNQFGAKLPSFLETLLRLAPSFFIMQPGCLINSFKRCPCILAASVGLILLGPLISQRRLWFIPALLAWLLSSFICLAIAALHLRLNQIEATGVSSLTSIATSTLNDDLDPSFSSISSSNSTTGKPCIAFDNVAEGLAGLSSEPISTCLIKSPPSFFISINQLEALLGYNSMPLISCVEVWLSVFILLVFIASTCIFGFILKQPNAYSPQSITDSTANTILLRKSCSFSKQTTKCCTNFNFCRIKTKRLVSAE
ncbi:unnamed protein product [Protopolystoma xenopodis]|uniref:Transmembrane protein n=1 Tax=Protopolystoma xenopodis TaxID=117903 RepID=A0A448WI36_9PLAT|nr:unnamed protein product [Protopolystoma xenopodis]